MLKVIITYILGIMCILGAYSQTRVDTLLNILNDGGTNRHVMVFAHRGDWRNAPAENSLEAYRNCIREGIDGIEVDLQMTSDSVLVIMHDETLDRTTTGHGLVSDHTKAQLDSLWLLSPIGVVTRLKIPTFEEVLELAKDNILIQVDKWKPFAPLVAQAIKKHQCGHQVIIRTTDPYDKFKRLYGNLFEDIIVMPVLVCRNSGDNNKLDDFMTKYSSPAISVTFPSTDFDVLNRLDEIKNKKYRLWLNSLWGSFNANHDDEGAMHDPDQNYGWLLGKGANIIFSDNPVYLKNYLTKKGYRIF